MIKQHRRNIIALLSVISIIGAFNVLGDTDEEYLVPTDQIAKYKSWLKVTPQPHEVKLTLGALGGG